MNVTKCDICKKEVDKPIIGAIGYFVGPKIELCEKCGAPILELLQKYKIIGKNKQKIKEN